MLTEKDEQKLRDEGLWCEHCHGGKAGYDQKCFCCRLRQDAIADLGEGMR